MRRALQEISSFRGTYESDPCLEYGKVVGNEVKGMKDLQRKFVINLINDVIHLGIMEMPTMDHQVLKSQSSCPFNTLWNNYKSILKLVFTPKYFLTYIYAVGKHSSMFSWNGKGAYI